MGMRRGRKKEEKKRDNVRKKERGDKAGRGRKTEVDK